MNKLTMAHDYAMKHVQEGFDINYDVLVVEAWQYADSMQDEADKRKVSGIPDVLRGANGEIVAVKVCEEEWQPDWSQAPVRATAWEIPNYGVPMWLQSHNNINQPYVWLSDAPSFNYKGDWKNSLRKRPQGE